MLVREAVPHELEGRGDVALARVVREALGGGRGLDRPSLLVEDRPRVVAERALDDDAAEVAPQGVESRRPTRRRAGGRRAKVVRPATTSRAATAATAPRAGRITAGELCAAALSSFDITE